MTYYVTYDVRPHPEGLTKEQVMATPEDVGACHAIVLISMIYNEDGSYSQAVITLDGRKGEDVEPNELFKVWSIMAHDLAEMEGLGKGRRALCQQVHEAVKAWVLQGRAAKVSTNG